MYKSISYDKLSSQINANYQNSPITSVQPKNIIKSSDGININTGTGIGINTGIGTNINTDVGVNVKSSEGVQQTLNNIIPLNDIFSYIDLRKYLQLISSINEGDKLTFSGDNINIDKRYYFQGLRRWYTSDSRDLTKNFINKILKSSEYYYSHNNKLDLQNLNNSLIISKIGIQNLILTYNEDKSFVSDMKINIELITQLCNRIST